MSKRGGLLNLPKLNVYNSQNFSQNIYQIPFYSLKTRLSYQMGAYLSKLLDDALEKPQEELFDPGKSFRAICLLLIFLSD